MRMTGYYSSPRWDPRKLDVYLGMVLSGTLIFFAVRPDLSVTHELLRIFIGFFTTLVALLAALSEKPRNVLILNIFLTLIFLLLFGMTFSVRILGAGEWYISEIFEVTLFDVGITGLLGALFYVATLRAAAELQKDKLKRKEIL